MSEIDHARALIAARHVAAESAAFEAGVVKLHGVVAVQIARAYLDLVERVLPELRRKHGFVRDTFENSGVAQCMLLCAGWPEHMRQCTCGTDAHNALIDNVIGKAGT